MTNEPSTCTVTVITRHSADCPKKADSRWRRCNCRKSLYIYADGKVSYKSAKTRKWEQAERLAQAERDLRDPLKIALREIEAQKVQAEAAHLAEQITVEDALGGWLRSQKQLAVSSKHAYATVARKINDWATLREIEYLRDVTTRMLEDWRGQWSPTAPRVDDKMGMTTQSNFLTRLKNFFAWAAVIGLIGLDPSLPLKSIRPSDKRTMPLTPKQFEELLAATERYDASQPQEEDRYGKDLKTLFLVMRWSGLRIADALMLPRTALVGNRLSLTTLKTKEMPRPILPDHVVTALLDLQPRPNTHPNYFFWSAKSHHLTLTTEWTARIRDFRRYLPFVDEQGQPMVFRSHMLRDTFAVELLLAGVPLEDVSRLLTHKSTRTTERYYAPWIKARRDQLDNKTVEAMRKMGVAVTL